MTADHTERLAEALERVATAADQFNVDGNYFAENHGEELAFAWTALENYRSSKAAAQDGWRRSEPYKQGYRAAWKDAITFLHEEAKGMNDPHATAILNSAAFSLGANKGYGRSLTARVEIPPPSLGSET